MCDPIKLFEAALAEYDNHSKWDGAPLGKVKTISNTKVGSVGQSFIEKLCTELNIPFSFPMNTSGRRLTQNPWDIEISGIQFELKTATEDTNNNFQFNHIRYHRPYQALLCLGVSPANLYFGIWSKADVVTGKAGNLVTMEKSANASFKLTKSPKVLFSIDHFYEGFQKFSESFKK